MNINIIAPDKHKFLQMNAAIDNFPKSLYLLGKLPETEVVSVAIVGTRKPTTYGKEMAYKLAYELARKGIVIISGLALGVDSIAHRAALDAGGRTIAIMPCGLDKVYPSSHQALANEIIDKGGALLSEYPTNTPTLPHHFIARNRIVSALSQGVIIIEAAIKSGTLHTANFAINQGKSVMAVPGNVTNPLSAGCNNLIKNGALLVTDTQDILEELGMSDALKQAVLPLMNNAEEKAIVELIVSGIRDGDELREKSGLDASTFSQTMTMLEIDGTIRSLGANQWAVK